MAGNGGGELNLVDWQMNERTTKILQCGIHSQSIIRWEGGVRRDHSPNLLVHQTQTTQPRSSKGHDKYDYIVKETAQSTSHTHKRVDAYTNTYVCALLCVSRLGLCQIKICQSSNRCKIVNPPNIIPTRFSCHMVDLYVLQLTHRLARLGTDTSL